MTDTDSVKLGHLLDEPAADVSDEQARNLAAWFTSAPCEVIALGGERDKNFRISTEKNTYVLKVLHHSEREDVLDFQEQALIYARNADGGLAIPRVVTTLDDGVAHRAWQTADQPARFVRMLTYVQGNPMHQITPTSTLRREVGACLARLDSALVGFSHPAQHQDLLWDLQRASQTRKLIVAVEDVELRQACYDALDRFQRNVEPHLDTLRRQVIHNDLNPHNIVIAARDSHRVAGMIDFGDMLEGPLVQDVATAAAYQYDATTANPLQSAIDVVAGFEAVMPLTELEKRLLLDMINARLALSIAINAWRAQQHPENASYILKNRSVAGQGLIALSAISVERAIAAFAA